MYMGYAVVCLNPVVESVSVTTPVTRTSSIKGLKQTIAQPLLFTEYLQRIAC